MLLVDEYKNMVGRGGLKTVLILGLLVTVVDQELAGAVLRKSWMEEPGT